MLAAGLAVVVYFWQDIWQLLKTFFLIIFRKNTDKKQSDLFWAIIIGTIPAVVLGLLLQKYMDTVFRGTTVVAFTLMAGAILFYFAERVSRQKIGQVNGLAESAKEIRGPEPELFSGGVNISKGFWIGLFQCLALLPGFSRSGATISGGLLTGLNRELAVRFSFLLSLPIILGSGSLKLLEIIKAGGLATEGSSLLWASLFAFVSGLLAIHFLIKFLKNHSLNYFGVYRILLAIVILIWL